MVLQTQRLVLRPFRVSDAPAVHAYGSDPIVTQFTEFGPNTWDETLGYLQTATRPTPPTIELGVTLREADEVVGAVHAHPVVPGRWEMGWVLRRDLWGQGIIPEAAGAVFDHLAARDDVVAIFARCRPENVASARVMEKLGMRYVETIPRDREVRGQWVRLARVRGGIA